MSLNLQRKDIQIYIAKKQDYHLDRTQEVPDDYKEIFFVCLRSDGSFELPSTVGIACHSARKSVPELEGFHFHTLRHTYTTNLLTNEAQPKDVQELLGHSDVSTTMNVYAHATREAKKKSAKLLDMVVGQMIRFEHLAVKIS